ARPARRGRRGRAATRGDRRNRDLDPRRRRLGPLIVVGMATAFDRTVRRVLLLLGVAAVLVYVLVALFGRSNVPPGPTIPGFGGPAEPSPVEQLLTVSIGGLIVVLAIAGML